MTSESVNEAGRVGCAETGSREPSPSSTGLGPSGFDAARELVEGVNEWLYRAAKLGAAQRRVILALGAEWGPSPDHQATKRMWYGITGRGIKRQRGPLYVVEHKHRTDNCWRLNDNGLRLQVALWAAGRNGIAPNSSEEIPHAD